VVRPLRIRLLALTLAVLALVGARSSAAATPQLAKPIPTVDAGCVADGSGSLRARLRGAHNADLNWRNADMRCESGARPDGKGLRLVVSGPLQASGRSLRLVFGLSDVKVGVNAKARPTNLTVIFEGERRLFATRGDDKCTVDELTQESLPLLANRVGANASSAPNERRWRVTLRGFCTEPAATIDQKSRLMVPRFDVVTELRLAP
jgi:hypothetical protein